MSDNAARQLYTVILNSECLSRTDRSVKNMHTSRSSFSTGVGM